MPEISGRTGTDLLVSVARTSTCTDTVFGSISTRPASTGWPSTSTATRSTGSLKSTSDALMLTNATARSTWSTMDAGPRTCTSSSLSTGSSISSPLGTALVSTATGTVRTSMRSISTRTVAGETDSTSTSSVRVGDGHVEDLWLGCLIHVVVGEVDTSDEYVRGHRRGDVIRGPVRDLDEAEVTTEDEGVARRIDLLDAHLDRRIRE